MHAQPARQWPALLTRQCSSSAATGERWSRRLAYGQLCNRPAMRASPGLPDDRSEAAACILAVAELHCPALPCTDALPCPHCRPELPATAVVQSWSETSTRSHRGTAPHRHVRLACRALHSFTLSTSTPFAWLGRPVDWQHALGHAHCHVYTLTPPPCCLQLYPLFADRSCGDMHICAQWCQSVQKPVNAFHSKVSS